TAGAADPGALPPSGYRPQNRAAAGVSPASRGPSAGRLARPGDRRREGAHRLLRALLQHRRGEPLLDLLLVASGRVRAVPGRIRRRADAGEGDGGAERVLGGLCSLPCNLGPKAGIIRRFLHRTGFVRPFGGVGKLSGSAGASTLTTEEWERL